MMIWILQTMRTFIVALFYFKIGYILLKYLHVYVCMCVCGVFSL